MYLLMTPGVVLAVIWVWRVLSSAETAGFSMKGVTWYQYGFTQARAVFEYLRLAMCPVGQSVDHDFPISHVVTEYGAIFYLVFLTALIAAAFLVRQRYPLATFGFFMFLILLAPTSSVIPIADPLVERRMYVPLVGLILVAFQAASGMRWSNRTVTLLAAILVLFGVLCYQRNQLWGKPEQIWARAAETSTKKGRPFLGLVESLIAENRCVEAVPYLERGESLMPHDFAIEVAWAKVLECQGKGEDALQRLERAAAILPNSLVYQLIGLLYAEMGKRDAAGAALLKATQLGPGNAAAHSALGLWYESMGDDARAEHEYREALSIYGFSTEAQAGLARIQMGTASRP